MGKKFQIPWLVTTVSSNSRVFGLIPNLLSFFTLLNSALLYFALVCHYIEIIATLVKRLTGQIFDKLNLSAT